jgi:hypothetical protein
LNNLYGLVDDLKNELFDLREAKKALKKPAPVARRVPTPEPVKPKPQPPKEVDIIVEITMKIFAKYDKDRSGFLDKGETLKLLDEILLS